MSMKRQTLPLDETQLAIGCIAGAFAKTFAELDPRFGEAFERHLTEAYRTLEDLDDTEQAQRTLLAVKMFKDDWS